MSASKLNVIFSSLVIALLASSSQTTLAAQTHQMPHPMAHQATGGAPTQTDINCPPGSQKGWIITEGHHHYMLFSDGSRINLAHPGEPEPGSGHGTHTTGETTITHHEGISTTHHELTEPQPQPKRSMHPEPTPEQEELIKRLKAQGKSHIFLRANPQTGKKEGEFGRELDGKVYFMELGLPVHDSTVDPVKDIVGTGVKARIAAMEAAQKANAAAQAEPAGPRPEAQFNVAPPSPVGLTVRTNTVRTNPQTGEREFQQGAPNVAQTGVTGGPAPHIDVPAAAPTGH